MSNPETVVKGYIERARAAQAAFESYTQQQVDEIVRAIAKTVYDNAEMLAKMAVEETGMGNYEDKVAKNKGKATVIWNSLKGKKSVGVISEDKETGIVEVAKPMGVAVAITPTTNPIVTPMSNAMFALKGRNAIIFLAHPRAINCGIKTVELINEALDKLGAPKNLIQILRENPREHTDPMMAAGDVVIATGGMGMVKAVYSSGKPALGVGAGNVQVLVDKDADLADAVKKIVIGRTFDNGIICSGEQTTIAHKDNYDAIVKEFEKNKAYVVTDKAEADKLRKAVFPDGFLNKDIVGQNALQIADMAGISVPADTKLFVVEADGPNDVFGKEKMCPVLATYQYETWEEGVAIAKTNLEREGKGHSVAIHSNNKEHIEYAGVILSVSRFVVNQTCATSAGGSFFNGLSPTNTLGCGSWGNNSISENLTYKHLINISRIAYFMKDNKAPTPDEIFA